MTLSNESVNTQPMSTQSKHKRYDTSINGGSGKVRQKATSWLAFVVLLVNILGGVAFTHPSAAYDLERICTTHGMVPTGGEPQDRTNHPSGGGGDFCPYCTPLLHGDIQAPSTGNDVAPAQVLFRSIVAFWQYQSFESSVQWGISSPRAPPLS